MMRLCLALAIAAGLPACATTPSRPTGAFTETCTSPLRGDDAQCDQMARWKCGGQADKRASTETPLATGAGQDAAYQYANDYRCR